MRLLVPDHFRHLVPDRAELGLLKEDLIKLRASGLGRERIIEKAWEAGWDRGFVTWFVDALNEHGSDLVLEVTAEPAPAPTVEVRPPTAYSEPVPVPAKETSKRWTPWRKVDLVLGLLIFALGFWALIPAVQVPLDNVRAMTVVIITGFFALSGLFVAFSGAIGHVLWLLLGLATFWMTLSLADSPSNSNHGKGIPIFLMGAYGLARLFTPRRAVAGWMIGGVFGLGATIFALALDSSKREDSPREEVLASASIPTPHEEAQERIAVLGEEIVILGEGSPTHDSVRQVESWINDQSDRFERETAELPVEEFKQLFDTKLFVTKAGRQKIKGTSDKFRKMISSWDPKKTTEEIHNLMLTMCGNGLDVKDEFIRAHLARNGHFMKMIDTHGQMMQVVGAGRVSMDKNGTLLFHSNR